MQIAFLFFDGMTALDAIGPYEVLGRLPGAEVRFVAAEPGEKRTDQNLGIIADHATGDVPAPDVLVVPGGNVTQPLNDPRVIDWVASVHQTSTWTTSVCTGAFVLGAAGVLRGLKATTHWSTLDELARYGAEPTSERVVEQSKVVTAAGVSSGIDMALRLVARIAGDDLAQAIQLGIEYDPQPPFEGSPSKAPAHVVEMLRGFYENAARDYIGT